MTDTPKFTAGNQPIVSTTEELRMALAAGHEPDTIILTAPDTEAVVAKAVADALAAERATFDAERIAWKAERVRLVDQAVQMRLPEQEDQIRLAERNRITEIQRLTRPGLEGVAQKAIDEGMAVAAFALEQLTTMNDRGITLDQIRADAPPPAPHARVPSDDKPSAAAGWDKAFANATGKKL